jgi:hypothetical protein
MTKNEALKIRQILDNPDLSNNQRIWEVSLLIDEALEHPKQWQGLSDEEIETIDINVIERLVDDEILEFARAIEAKLKEKNTER